MTADPRSDGELVQAANGGDAGAFEALYRRYRDWVTSLAWRFTGSRDLALDVAQETFMYLLRKFPGFELRAQMTTFLYPVVRNLAMTARQKARRFSGPDPQTLEDAAVRDESRNAAADPSTFTSGGFGGGDRGGGREQLATVMSRLSEEHRETVLLRFVDDLSIGQIALAMGVPAGTVKSRLHHALKKLRDDPGVKKYFEP